MKHIAAFITPHGFGHATRAIAVLAALQQRYPGLGIELFTTVPEHIFQESLYNFTLHPVQVDVGIIQQDALHNDISATITALDQLFSFSEADIEDLKLKLNGCCAVLCDIAPLGIIAAAAAGIPSVLVENFTWDWIYQPFLTQYPPLCQYVEKFARIYCQADYHIQCTPVCSPVESSLHCKPISRLPALSAKSVLNRLGAGNRKIILISLGGIDFTLPRWRQIDALTEYLFILAGQPENIRISENCLALSTNSGYYHPDIIQAADLVICKSGYSTTVECLHAGTRIASICRPAFAESAVLADFIQNSMHGTLLTEEVFRSGQWISNIPEMLSRPRPTLVGPNGAEQVADLLQSLLC
jgi:UDP:flavonoid glycosyltransferase YjiC (YdhE family)